MTKYLSEISFSITSIKFDPRQNKVKNIFFGANAKLVTWKQICNFCVSHTQNNFTFSIVDGGKVIMDEMLGFGNKFAAVISFSKPKSWDTIRNIHFRFL